MLWDLQSNKIIVAQEWSSSITEMKDVIINETYVWIRTRMVVVMMIFSLWASETRSDVEVVAGQVGQAEGRCTGRLDRRHEHLVGVCFGNPDEFVRTRIGTVCLV